MITPGHILVIGSSLIFGVVMLTVLKADHDIKRNDQKFSAREKALRAQQMQIVSANVAAVLLASFF